MPGSAAAGLTFAPPLIFERGASGRTGASLAPLDVPEVDPAAHFGAFSRTEPARLPEVSEPEAQRHYVQLSQQNFAIDTGMYPLGSCTMKYNPKVNEWAASPAPAAQRPARPATARTHTTHYANEVPGKSGSYCLLSFGGNPSRQP